MKIGFFSDIHSNIDALEAVICEASKLDALIFLGDLVGYYDMPNECCNLIREKSIPTIVGNHDQYVLYDQPYDNNKEWLYRIEWTRKELSKENFRWMRNLPIEMRFRFSEWNFTVRHASPWDVSTYLYKDSTKLNELHLLSNECLVLGHTHHALKIKRAGGWILNVGSAGQPRSGEPGADLAVFDTSTGRPELRRVPYNINMMSGRLRLKGWPIILIQKLVRPGYKQDSD